MDLSFICMYSESEGGVSISKNPAMIKSVAVNFQFQKLTFLAKKSTAALIGIPRRVPMEIKSGKVYAIPKLMLKLKRTPSAELAQI